ncbi:MULTISPECIES: MerR family transcriptional regulator [Streptosporangium]|uniref:DNA-binding transcriptional MerR regulator n=1 Tax=Streptosporangium brasiliense TaxID=47480 RepID=A0ABT9R816_9ACTN|nr:MerR family transcriptional regulator [Streptosporangium brasiliense]MDP9865380.1 DNA-binding transcriptional MerR regulator [Streptosporangium brasiliense]
MKSSAGAEMTIGELAARFDLAPHVLRHWEAMGLLTPARRANGRRRYTDDHLSRVTMIVRGKAGGLSLEQLREILNAATSAERRELLSRHRAELELRIQQTQMSKQLVEHALDCREEDFTRCRTFQRLCADLPVPTGRREDPPAGETLGRPSPRSF